MSDSEQQYLEGGSNQLPQQIQRIHLDASLEGGNLLAQINQEYPPISASGADRIQGVESALLTGNPAVPVAASSDLPIVGGIAVSTFGFPSPFQAPTNNERPSAMLRAWTPGLLRPRHRFWPRRLALLLRSPRLFQHRIKISLKCRH